MQKFREILEVNPIIAAVKDMDSIEHCCEEEEIKVVFVLFGDVCSIKNIVKQIKDTGRMAVVHIDLIAGLSAKEIAVDFMKKEVNADGIISTKPTLIKRAMELEMYTVLRVFLIDSMVLENLKTQVYHIRPDFVEVLPGIIPRVIKQVKRSIKSPIIAGGLISTKEDVMAALAAGATSVSTTSRAVWKM
ncbi:MAG: glycerol-3-phosphate responsive antiterminator [Lachnospiraceae bacterium]